MGRLLAGAFGQAEFRPQQREAIEGVLAGRDVSVLLPTGAGKSLCYQLAALALRRRGLGPTWVISPLVALMNDQVAALRKRQIAAVAWHSGLCGADGEAAQRAFFGHHYDIAFLSPERATTAFALSLAQRARVALLAVDEAHCVSQWGHDFRPEYRQLGALKQSLGAPCMALTATATAEAHADICRALKLVRPLHCARPPVRENLVFSVSAPAPLTARVQRLAQTAAAYAAVGRTLVYAATRQAVAQAARACTEAGTHAEAYHAGLAPPVRTALERRFAAGEIPLLVATCAFGMGIDRHDVRRVIHLQAPGRLEALYQEAGRAGRDHRLAWCELWWGPQDWAVQRRIGGNVPAKAQAAAQSGLLAMQRYVGTWQCRQEAILAHFGAASLGPCERCDVCTASVPPAATRAAGRAALPAQPLAASKAAQVDDAIVAMMGAVARPVGRSLLTLALRGSKAAPVQKRKLVGLPGYGACRGIEADAVGQRIAALLQDGRMCARGKKYPTVWLASRPTRGGNAGARGARTGARKTNPLTLALQRLCRAQAKALGWPKPYMVLTKKAVAEVVRLRPHSLQALQGVAGIGPKKISLFGEEVVAVVARYG